MNKRNYYIIILLLAFSLFFLLILFFFSREFNNKTDREILSISDLKALTSHSEIKSNPSSTILTTNEMKKVIGFGGYARCTRRRCPGPTPPTDHPYPQPDPEGANCTLCTGARQPEEPPNGGYNCIFHPSARWTCGEAGSVLYNCGIGYRGRINLQTGVCENIGDPYGYRNCTNLYSECDEWYWNGYEWIRYHYPNP
ncbi:MAG: hypothetical protein N3A72_00340 [bacterium]|nr:hypothetical protein [bacterium]